MELDIDYNSLILGLSSAALGYMGFSEGGKHDFSKANLPLARQNIEIIALLQAKTAGNLTKDEERLTTEVLTDLRLKFVEMTKIKS